MEQPHQLPLRRAETAAVFVLIVQSVAGLLALLLGWVSKSAAARVEAWHLLVGALVWLAVVVHQRLRRLADEEVLEAEAVDTSHRAEGGSSLFESEGADLLSARTRLGQFEKFFLPALSILIALALGAASAHQLYRLIRTPEPAAVERALMTAVVFFGIAFVSFLLARYTAGLATQTPWRPLRAGANYSMSCAAGSLLVGIALVCDHFDLPVVGGIAAYVLAGVLGLLAIEVVLNLVMAIYRPRVPGQELRPAHDSRALGILTTSGGILRATAETLDYQFGFKVSETWFYRFMERALLPLIFFQLGTLYLLTCFVIVDTGEQAVIERFGAPRQGGEPLGPGLHVKWPWPIEIVYRHPVDRIEMLTIGEQLKEDVPGYIWTVSHAKEPFQLLVANRAAETGTAAEPGAEPKSARDERQAPPVSMLAGSVLVYYRVNNLYEYLYSQEDPKEALTAICNRELTRYAASADYLELLGEQLGQAMRHLQANIQRRANGRSLGVEIITVSLQGLHPPPEAGQSFEAYVGAFEEKEAEVWRARGDEATLVPLAEAAAAVLVNEAKADSHSRQQLSPAIERRFRVQLDAFRRAPGVYVHRLLCTAMEEGLGECRKIIKPAWAKYPVGEVLYLDLSEKLLPGLGLDLESSGE